MPGAINSAHLKLTIWCTGTERESIVNVDMPTVRTHLDTDIIITTQYRDTSNACTLSSPQHSNISIRDAYYYPSPIHYTVLKVCQIFPWYHYTLNHLHRLGYYCLSTCPRHPYLLQSYKGPQLHGSHNTIQLTTCAYTKKLYTPSTFTTMLQVHSSHNWQK